MDPKVVLGSQLRSEMTQEWQCVRQHATDKVRDWVTRTDAIYSSDIGRALAQGGRALDLRAKHHVMHAIPELTPKPSTELRRDHKLIARQPTFESAAAAAVAKANQDHCNEEHTRTVHANALHRTQGHEKNTLIASERAFTSDPRRDANGVISACSSPVDPKALEDRLAKLKKFQGSSSVEVTLESSDNDNQQQSNTIAVSSDPIAQRVGPFLRKGDFAKKMLPRKDVFEDKEQMSTTVSVASEQDRQCNQDMIVNTNSTQRKKRECSAQCSLPSKGAYEHIQSPEREKAPQSMATKKTVSHKSTL